MSFKKRHIEAWVAMRNRPEKGHFQHYEIYIEEKRAL